MKTATQQNGNLNYEGSLQWCAVRCVECGKLCGQYLAHYELVRCFCGEIYWALNRTTIIKGKLTLSRWPGNDQTPRV